MSKSDEDILKKNGTVKQSNLSQNKSGSIADTNSGKKHEVTDTTASAVKSPIKLKLDTYTSIPLKKFNDDKAPTKAAVIGAILGIILSVLIAATSDKQSMLGMLFNFESKQIVLPVVMMCMFCWGIAISFMRRSRTLKIEKISNSEVIADLSYNLTQYSPLEMHDKLEEMPISQICPMLRRLRVVLRQWSSKPNLQDSMSLIEQMAVSDSEDIRHTYGIVKTFIWSLPVLGLIGTVIGIALAVGDFGQLLGGNVSDVAVIKTSLIRVTAGLSYAFTTTLLGLLGALFLTLFSSIMQTREEKLNKRAESTIVDHYLPLIQGMHPEQTNSGLQADFSDLHIYLKEIVRSTVQLAGTVADEILADARDKFNTWQNQIIEANHQSMLQISDASVKIGDNISQTTVEFVKSLSQVLSALQNTIESSNQIHSSAADINQKLTSCQTNIQSNIKQFESMDLATVLQNLGENLKYTSEVLKQFHEPLVFQAVPARTIK